MYQKHLGTIPVSYELFTGFLLPGAGLYVQGSAPAAYVSGCLRVVASRGMYPSSSNISLSSELDPVPEQPRQCYLLLTKFTDLKG